MMWGTDTRFGNFLLAALGNVVFYLDLIVALDSSSSSSTRQITYSIDMSQEDQVQQVANIVDALEHLGVLDQSHATCYSLEKMVKTQENVADGVWKIAVEFHVTELGSTAYNSDKNGKTSDNSDDASLENSRFSEGCTGKVHQTGAVTASDMTRLEQEDEVVTDTTDYVTQETIAAVGSNVSQAPSAGSKLSKGERPLSIAQIMVISTCSTVIGLFFLVALTMRIRNYVKRKREKRKSRRRVFRSTDLAISSTKEGTSSESDKSDPSKLLKVAAGAKVLPIERLHWPGREHLLSM